MRHGRQGYVLGVGVAGPILPTVWMPDDIKRLQADVQRESLLLDKQVVSCLSKLSKADIDAWSALLNRAQAFAQETVPLIPTGAMPDEGQAIQRDMQPWYGKLTAAGCNPGPAPSVAPTPGALFGQLSPALLLGLLVLLVHELKR